jgi:transposase
VRVGLESTGNSHWFVDMLTEMQHEVWVGDAAKIRAKQVRKQKTDRRDAVHILDLMMKDDFTADLDTIQAGARSAAVADSSL